jgi:hypothetical protein
MVQHYYYVLQRAGIFLKKLQIERDSGKLLEVLALFFALS